MIMDISVDNLVYELSPMDEGVIRIVVLSGNQEELGSLYFERAKKTFQRKPIGMDAWGCVDAKIERLYEYGGDNITPKDIVGKCQELIREYVTSL
jgi:hypothetical protein